MWSGSWIGAQTKPPGGWILIPLLSSCVCDPGQVAQPFGVSISLSANGDQNSIYAI